MIRALLLTSFQVAHVDATMAPELLTYGIRVVRVERVAFKGLFEDIDAVIVIEQGTTEGERAGLRKRAHEARAAFVVLPADKALWGHALADVRAPEAAPEPAAAPTSITFGAWLKERREAAGMKQHEVSALCGVSTPLVGAWETDKASIAAVDLAKIHDLYGPAPAHVLPPRTPQRVHRRKAEAEPIATAPVDILPATNGHAVIAPASSLSGLRRAARALGMAGNVVVDVGDAETVVTIGETPWRGPDPDAAIAAARADLDGRMVAMLRTLEEARAELRGAA